MARLVLGPLLRYVAETEATVWVETDSACEVEVLGRRSSTFEVEGHHYCILGLEGLEPGARLPYGVALDGEPAWPGPSSGLPAGLIRTLPPAGEPVRVTFGSCRRLRAWEEPGDALHALAARTPSLPTGEWPHLLLLVGDQVYIDYPGADVMARIEARRGTSPPVGETADFEEMTWLYREAWGSGNLPWLLASVPSLMVVDDHEVADCWGSSAQWWRRARSHPWWRERFVGAVMAFWLYQHLGNLSPAELAADPVLAALRSGDGGEALRALAEGLEAAGGTGAGGWSYRRDLGASRLLVLDARSARVLDEGRRDLLGPGGWRWLESHLRGDVDHLLVASSVPVLLPAAVHDLEAWSEAVAAGAWGRYLRGVGEWARELVPLEHWAAFRGSFARLAVLLRAVAEGRRGKPPASILLLSGDVHYSYAAPAELPGPGSAVVQIVCSPLRNRLSSGQRLIHRLSTSAVCRLALRALAGLAGVRRAPLAWRLAGGPWFDNAVASVDLVGESARVTFERAVPGRDGPSLVARASYEVAARRRNFAVSVGS